MNEEFTNEIMETEIEETEGSGISTGVAMLIGGLLTAGGYFAGKGIKKAYKFIKTKKTKNKEFLDEDFDDFEGELVEEDE